MIKNPEICLILLKNFRGLRPLDLGWGAAPPKPHRSELPTRPSGAPVAPATFREKCPSATAPPRNIGLEPALFRRRQLVHDLIMGTPTPSTSRW